MEKNISNSETHSHESDAYKICEKLGIQLNHFQNVKGNSNGKQINISSDIFDIRNFRVLRKKQILSLGKDYFNEKLSNELILAIFKWLPKKDLVHCTMVCKRWHQVAQIEILWSRLDLYRTTLHEDTLWHILSRGIKVLRLAQAKILTLTSQTRLQNINDTDIYKLQYLDASIAMIPPDNLAILLSKCRNLKKLSLESCTLNEACFKAIGQCIDLSVLNLGMCEGVDLKCILHLIKLRSLTKLNLAWCSLDAVCVSLLCKSLPRSIIGLNISGCVKTIMDDNITDLVNSCPDLIQLDLSDCYLLTSSSLDSMLELSKLQHLALNRCRNIHASTLIKLTYMPSLIYLDIFECLVDPILEHLKINCFMFSSIARPTIGNNKGAIWNLHVKN